MRSMQRGQRVAGAARPTIDRKRDIDGLLDENALVALRCEHHLPRLDRGSDGRAGLADPLAGIGLGGRRQGADLAVRQRQR